MAPIVKLLTVAAKKSNISKLLPKVEKTASKEIFRLKNVETKAVTNPVENILKREQNTIDYLRKNANLSRTESSKLYNYLPEDAKNNFDMLLKAGKRAGFLKTDKNGLYNPKSLKKFMTTFDKDTYQKMMILEQNFAGLEKADFKKLLSAYKTPEKMLKNKANIQKWLNCKKDLYYYSKDLEKEGMQKVDECAKEIEEIFGIKPQVRGKSLESIYDKLSREVLKGEQVENYAQAKSKIRDLFGGRLVLDDVSPQNIQKIVDNLCKGIQSGKVKPTLIHNYANASMPYFSEQQFEQIRKAAAKKGYEIPRLESEQISKSGYVTAQMNIHFKNDICGELQIRGKLMNKYGEIEHIPYDIRMGKNIGKNIPELEKFFEPVEEAVNKLKRNGLNKVYDKYILDCYKYIRKYERQKIKSAFKLPRIPKSLKDYSILSFESLDKIHTQAEAIKNTAKVAKAA